MRNYRYLISYLGQSKYREYFDSDRFIDNSEIYDENHWSPDFIEKYGPGNFHLNSDGYTLAQDRGGYGYVRKKGDKYVLPHETDLSLICLGIGPEIPEITPTKLTLFDTKTGCFFFCAVPSSEKDQLIDAIMKRYKL